MKDFIYIVSDDIQKQIPENYDQSYTPSLEGGSLVPAPSIQRKGVPSWLD